MSHILILFVKQRVVVVRIHRLFVVTRSSREQEQERFGLIELDAQWTREDAAVAR